MSEALKLVQVMISQKSQAESSQVVQIDPAKVISRKQIPKEVYVVTPPPTPVEGVEHIKVAMHRADVEAARGVVQTSQEANIEVIGDLLKWSREIRPDLPERENTIDRHIDTMDQFSQEGIARGLFRDKEGWNQLISNLNGNGGVMPLTDVEGEMWVDNVKKPGHLRVIEIHYQTIQSLPENVTQLPENGGFSSDLNKVVAQIGEKAA